MRTNSCDPFVLVFLACVKGARNGDQRPDLILTTCPRDCYDSCGVAVRVRDGVIAQVRGDPNHPMSRGALCVKCSAGYNNEWLDPAVR